MKRKALGKGLSSLLPQNAPTKAAAEKQVRFEGLTEIDIDMIRPNPRQPRESFEAGALEELSSSLKKQGVLQPIVVRSIVSGGYEIVVGERRWRAAQQAGLLKVPAVVRPIADDQLLETALIENVQRENLNPIEEARAYRAILQEGRLSQEELASRVGKQRATVTNALRLLALPDDVQERIRSGQLSMGHGRALLGLPSAEEQRKLAERAARDRLSVREVETIVAKAGRQPTAIGRGKVQRRDPNVVAAEEALQSALGTRVRILQGSKGGRIEIHFHDSDELERVYDLVLEASRVRRKSADKQVGGPPVGRQVGRHLDIE
jgi:ParB family chromosome partitioning protein